MGHVLRAREVLPLRKASRQRDAVPLMAVGTLLLAAGRQRQARAAGQPPDRIRSQQRPNVQLAIRGESPLESVRCLPFETSSRWNMMLPDRSRSREPAALSEAIKARRGSGAHRLRGPPAPQSAVVPGRAPSSTPVHLAPGSKWLRRRRHFALVRSADAAGARQTRGITAPARAACGPATNRRPTHPNV